MKEYKFLRNMLIACMMAFIVITGIVNCGNALEYIHNNSQPDSQQEITTEEEQTEEVVATEEDIKTEEATKSSSVIQEDITPATISEEVVKEEETPTADIFEIENYQENIAKWCLDNDNTNTLTVWKRTDPDSGNLLIALKSTETDCFVATFEYEGFATDYNEWTLCNSFFEEVTVQEIIDYSFTAYHEVGGKNPKNVQAQIQVLINRQKSPDFPDSIRKVITQKAQYSCAKCVTNRIMKSDSFLEEEDLEKCFRQTLLVLARELILEVPEDVVFAAKGVQGKVWMEIDKTIYCFS